MHYRLLILLFIIFLSAVAFAQVSAPPRDQTQAAVLADMSRRAGETVTINSLASQQWYYGTYDFVRSLGCTLAPQSPATSGNWQRFVFNYRGLDYIYMVSDNLQSLILCNEPSLSTAIPPTAQPSATLQGSGQSGSGVVQSQPTATLQGSGQGGSSLVSPTPTFGIVDAGNMPTPDLINCPLIPRLSPFGMAFVTPGDANWLHAESRRSAEKIGEIPAETQFRVLAGPVCDSATGMNYWQVNYNGLIGWTSEGLNGEYWIEPLNDSFSPETVNNAFVPEWLNNAMEGSLIASSTEFAAIMPAANQVDVIQLSDNSRLANYSFLQVAVTSLDFSSTGDYFLIGLDDGQIELFHNPPTFEKLASLSHEGAITATAFNHSENLLVVADEARILTFWSMQALDTPLRRIDIGAVVSDLEFSNDDRLLLLRNRQGELITALQIP